jgi:hypothetical protein
VIKLAILAVSWQLLPATCCQLGAFCFILLASFAEHRENLQKKKILKPKQLKRLQICAKLAQTS